MLNKLILPHFQDLEIHGVMRFYFQESKEKVATKCIRVSSTATTRAVIEALVEKFHPDLKMLATFFLGVLSDNLCVDLVFVYFNLKFPSTVEAH